MTSILVTATQFTSNLDSTHANGRRLFPPMRREQGIAALMASRNIFNAASPRLGAGWRENEDDYIENNHDPINDQLNSPPDLTAVALDVYAILGRSVTFQHFARDVHLCIDEDAGDPGNSAWEHIGGTIAIRGAKQLRRLIISHHSSSPGRHDTWSNMTEPIHALIGHCLELPTFESLHFRNMQTPESVEYGNMVELWWFPEDRTRFAPLRELTFAVIQDGDRYADECVESGDFWNDEIFPRLARSPYARTLQKLCVRQQGMPVSSLRKLKTAQSSSSSPSLSALHWRAGDIKYVALKKAAECWKAFPLRSLGVTIGDSNGSCNGVDSFAPRLLPDIVHWFSATLQRLVLTSVEAIISPGYFQSALEAICSNLSQLRVFIMLQHSYERVHVGGEEQVYDALEAAQELSKLQQLEELRLSHAFAVSDNLSFVDHLPRLKILDLDLCLERCASDQLVFFSKPHPCLEKFRMCGGHNTSGDGQSNGFFAAGTAASVRNFQLLLSCPKLGFLSLSRMRLGLRDVFAPSISSYAASSSSSSSLHTINIDFDQIRGGEESNAGGGIVPEIFSAVAALASLERLQIHNTYEAVEGTDAEWRNALLKFASSSRASKSLRVLFSTVLTDVLQTQPDLAREMFAGGGKSSNNSNNIGFPALEELYLAKVPMSCEDVVAMLRRMKALRVVYGLRFDSKKMLDIQKQFPNVEVDA